MRGGRFIVFEGGEACGKSTQAARLAQRLDAVLTREPGDTTVGARLRELLLDPATGELDPRTEALMMAADRAQHVASVVRPALAAGRDVVCDRYAGSSIAYQGHGRGLDPTEVSSISGWASGELWPDLVVLLEVPAGESAVRLGGDHDRFEAAGAAFHQRVAEGFVAQALADPQRWRRVDGVGTIDEVGARVDATLAERRPDADRVTS